MPTLLLRMPADSTQETEWLLVDESGARAGPSQRGPLSLAAAVASNHSVTVLVPATDVLLAQPDLPPGSGARLAKTVPYALEEQVSDDIDLLHFAIGKRAFGAATPVAVVKRDLVQSWREELSAAGLRVSSMYADVSLLPDNPSHAVVWVEGSRLSVRRPSQTPFTVDVSPINEALEIAGLVHRDTAETTMVASEPGALELATVLDTPTVLEHVLLYASPADWDLIKDDVGALIDRFASLKVQLLAEGSLPWLAQQLPSAPAPSPYAISLLQGEFAPPKEYGAHLRRWRLAAALGVALLLAHVGAEGFELYRAHQQQKRVEQDLGGLVAATLPGTPIDDARRIMQSRLQQARSGGRGDEMFLRTLQSVSRALVRQEKTSVDALSFRDATLDLKITAPNVDAIAQLSQSIVASGLTAEIQSSNPAGNAIEGRLQVRNAARGRNR